MRQSKVCLILLRYKMNMTLFQKAFMILNKWAGFIEGCCTLNSLNFPCFSEIVTNGSICCFSTVTAALWRAQDKKGKLNLISKRTPD